MPEITAEQLAELVALVDEATGAYIRGDMQRCLALFDLAEAHTLMPPQGGEVQHRTVATEEEVAGASRFFASGEGRFELGASYVAGDLVVLAGVERQHGEVGGFPDQDWSLRVTLVFRRVGDRWQLVHRHADALVRPVSFEHVAELARGVVS